MLSVAPASVLFIGLLGMFVVAFSVLRMTLAERRVQHAGPARTPVHVPAPRPARPRAHI